LESRLGQLAEEVQGLQIKGRRWIDTECRQQILWEESEKVRVWGCKELGQIKD
jgi:hypothetical protein